MLATVWLIVTLIFLAFVLQPVGLGAQLLYATCTIGSMALIHAIKLRHPMWRHVFVVMGCAVALRYLYWRWTNTLPNSDQLASFIAGYLLFFAELYAIGMLFISTIVNSDPVKRKPVQLSGTRGNYPSVDIFIPSYNEDDDILGTTLAAAANLRYPAEKLNVYLLDDGGTDQKCKSDDPVARQSARNRKERLQAFCAELGIHYITRARNEMAKAGNLNEGLKHSTGDLVVVFDADHAPTREFLEKTVGYFQVDPKLFLVQTPHQFLNPDPIEKNLDTYRFMPSENEMFYSVTQKGLDKWDATFFCGSAAVLRREALETVGGFNGVSITEDCETALELHARGWSSAYVDEPMIAGFQPETFDAFLTQRSRWCQGMMQILLLRLPMFRKGLKPMQRLAYLSSMLFWLFPLSRFIFVFSPVLYIFFDLQIYHATFQEFLAYTCTYMVAATIMQNYLFGRVRWPWISETYEYVQSFALSRVIFSTLRNPRKPVFKVTDKGLSLEEDSFSSHGWSLLIAFIVLLATFLNGMYRLWLDGMTNELLMVVTIWSFFNLVLGGLGLGAAAERKQRRRHYRMDYTTPLLTGILTIDGEQVGCELDNLAIGGLAVVAKASEALPAAISGKLGSISIAKKDNPDHTLYTFNVVVRSSTAQGGERRIGLGLHASTAMDRRVLAGIMFPDNSQLVKLRDGRQKSRPVLYGTFIILQWSAYQAWRGMSAALRSLLGRSSKDKAAPEPAPLSNR
ncbi:UDP-forming cellulose synthase catalytic subunit [Cohaesibacter celericrescens]|uniref:Cellulose synthase catalytic subunit [UDP-forming] n=1 Tax=Cohaesibacter celericrescens TaxID=2067669 RepID=A0A2N5XV73_9HYPH|nr:UDP-forming cellulose synthase catalytic subunit [Cohaesibacter celericrescens]PLW78389.1 cellulose synthase catalytic subunit (UDP-forming) [Cohaesibacter celericrescens]